jgi:hypothetical protein
MKANKVGRPKKPKNELKIGISVKLRPETLELLEKAEGKNKSVKVENAIQMAYN